LNNNKQYEGELISLEKNSVGLSHQSYNFNDNQYALAIDAAAPVSSYRSDLIENPPSTFEETI
jgi:multiple sugar transport system substrate-binding protein